jgi:nicotinic acid mononucleotide adenylyltransferase
MNSTEKEKIIITYQGAFSPPTLGHEDGARKLMQKAIELYPTKTIELKFMPSNDAESKDSLNKTKSNIKSYMSFEDRTECLNAICLSLKDGFGGENYTFSVSDIEQEFTKINPPITSKTICTLMVLSKQNPDAEIILGIGADNMANMIDWAHSLAVPYPKDKDPKDPISEAQLREMYEQFEIDDPIPQEYYYKDYINKIFVLDRTVNNGELVSDTPVDGTIDGIKGEVINIPTLDYTKSDSNTKPIPIVRTEGWGRTDVKDVLGMITNSYGTIFFSKR